MQTISSTKGMEAQVGRPGKKADRLNGRGLAVVSLFEEKQVASREGAVPLGYDPQQPESSYNHCVPIEHRKRYGQFFTPPVIADILCDWVQGTNPGSLLDPAVGTGILLRRWLARRPQGAITAIDVDPQAIAAARQALPEGKVAFRCCDFLRWESRDRFDGILANPPYLRHHDMLYASDIFQAVGKRNGVHLSRLTNAYCLFILEICRRLKPKGRAGIIVPGEWLNANFGMPIKDFLLTRGFLRRLVYFSHASLVFEHTLSTACLLFVERCETEARSEATLPTVFVGDGVQGEVLRAYLRGEQSTTAGISELTLPTEQLVAEKKWDYVLQNGVPEKRPGFVSLAVLARTCRGVATGANSFFHLPDSESKKRGIGTGHLVPCVGRAKDVKGFVFDERDFAGLSASGRPAYLVCLKGRLTPSESAYVAEGEALGLPQRYLLACRSPWYAMESRPPAPIWAAVFGRNRLKFVWNRAGIHNLTTFHCVYPRRGDPDFVAALVACLNSTVVQATSQHQQRVYGGGLRKFEPRDLLEVSVPQLEAVSERTLRRLHDLLLRLDEYSRSPVGLVQGVSGAIDEAVIAAGVEAARRAGPSRSRPDRVPGGLLWEQPTHSRRLLPRSP